MTETAMLPPSVAITAAAKEISRARKDRVDYFDGMGCVFGEPMWDLMLELFIAEREDRRVSLARACVTANVPVSTAMRWLALMESEAILVREFDAKDCDRAFVRLHSTASRSMERYISDVVLGEVVRNSRSGAPSTRANA